MRIKNATKATPPTTPPAITPGLIWLEADSVVLCGWTTEVDNDVAPIDVDVSPIDVDGALVAADVELGFDIVLAPEVDKNGAATRGFESRKPAVKSATGQPLVVAQGLDLQQPMNGGSVKPQVYHRLPEGHCWSGNFP